MHVEPTVESSNPVGWLRDEAQRLGFSKIAIARAGPLPGCEHFDDWLCRGLHGEMTWMERQAERRRDPSLVLPDIRSIVVLSMNYYPGDEPRRGPMSGVISRYARGDDYHTVMGERLARLLHATEAKFPGTLGLWYVDTGPVAEKAWAAASSLGWLGKHTNILNREQGSWFFIGVVMLNRELACDEAAEDYCGSCDSCIRSCPTGAIIAPYVVDARLCISYLTIELRGSIPRGLRHLVGNRIFGCDDCQEVCPWNRFAIPTNEAAFAPREGLDAPLLDEFAGISAEDFRSRFRGSPILRARRNGFVRNVVVALGNTRDPAAVPPLLRALRDDSSLVRGHAAWGLGRVGGSTARAALELALSSEPDSDVAGEIRHALCECGA